MASSSELGCVYAALILADDGVDVTDEKISTLLKAANVEFEPFWPGLFANALAGKDVKDMVSNIGSASAAPAGAAPAGGAPAGDAAPAAAAKKEEPEEESDGEMDGFSLFD